MPPSGHELRCGWFFRAPAIVRIFSFMPTGAAGAPTLERPVRNTLWPEMNDDRPAVQDCSP